MDRSLLFNPPKPGEGSLVCVQDDLTLGDGRGLQATFRRGDVLPEAAFSWPGIAQLLLLDRLRFERHSEADAQAHTVRDRLRAEIAALEARHDQLVAQIEAGEKALEALRAPLRGATAAESAVAAWRAVGGPAE